MPIWRAFTADQVLRFNKISIFDSTYLAPRRNPGLGHLLMVVSILMLLFIVFIRLWHFTFIRMDAMLYVFFQLTKLPVASTFWCYIGSLGINQANSFFKIISALRQRVWQLYDINYYKIRISIDTTVETTFGNQQGGCKGIICILTLVPWRLWLID